jgi:NADPH:quinone reductase-like Zn-dependent oxidoreductase
MPLPLGLAPVQATTLVVQGLTAALVLREAGRLTPGETVAVEAAAGGVGSFAVQLAKLFGAKQVIGLASDGAKCAKARQLGADEAKIDEAFHGAIRTAKQQKSISLTKRAEATYKNSAAERESVRGNTGSDCLLQISCSSLPFLKHPPEKSFLNAGFRSAAQVPRSQEFCY